MRVAYLGNAAPPFSTENDVAHTLTESMGVEVTQIQENDTVAWRHLTDVPQRYDAILWTSTRDLAAQVPTGLQLEMLYRARRADVPTIGFHLDRWWGLERWRTVLEAPFFRCEYVFTADGAHQDEFAAAGVNHFWSPPAIAPRNVGRGEPDPMFACDVAFVGSWQGGYHGEWKHRAELVTWLQRTYGRRCRLFPEKGQPAVRGKRLADLYASAKVVVGDSCLVPTVSGKPMHHYCSDRVFETLGRGGFLLHPYVSGITRMFPDPTDDAPFQSGKHLWTWVVDNWAQLRDNMDYALESPDKREETQQEGFHHVAAHHTYWNRLDAVFKTVGLKDDYTRP